MPDDSLLALCAIAAAFVVPIGLAGLRAPIRAQARAAKYRAPFPAPDFGGPDLADRAERHARKAGFPLPLF